jgi:hypothetical protein
MGLAEGLIQVAEAAHVEHIADRPHPVSSAAPDSLEPQGNAYSIEGLHKR